MLKTTYSTESDYESDYLLPFSLPIFYNKSKQQLKKHIATDLELIVNTDETDVNGGKSVYEHIICGTDKPDNDTVLPLLLKKSVKYYTTDISFLEHSQKILKNYFHPSHLTTAESYNFAGITKMWKDIRCDPEFKEKYGYIDFELLESLNTSPIFLQLMSMYNITSPIFSLFTPILILIIPLFILKARGLDISISEYIKILKQTAGNHAICKMFSCSLETLASSEGMYMIASIGFYFFSIYQNIMACIQFQKNMKKIHVHFNSIVDYLTSTLQTMEAFQRIHHLKSCQAYHDFDRNLTDHYELLGYMKTDISKIATYSFSLKKISELGEIMKCFYKLYSNDHYGKIMHYSFIFNRYALSLYNIQENLRAGHINFAKFSNDSNDTVSLKDSYYAPLKLNNPITNNVNLKKNIILTGPNAAGKTTLLKATLINVILSQQFGVGCFKKETVIVPYKYIHCYLNIPDTSGRDSLFQAEARRCKEIIDCIKNDTDKDARHLCGFDELYSGTNPAEAVESATLLMKYFGKDKRVNCILTTHFLDICEILNSDKRVKNCCMKVKEIKQDNGNTELKYTYKIKKGISTIKGGMAILREMGYPDEFVKAFKQI